MRPLSSRQQASGYSAEIFIKGIEAGLLTAAGLSDKSLAHLLEKDKKVVIKGLIKNFLEPSGKKFVEELVFRFLLTRSDTLGGSMRNVGGALAQRKLTRSILSTLSIAGIKYQWQHSKTRKWVHMNEDDSEIELSLRGKNWKNKNVNRTIIFNLTVPLVNNNVDVCLFNLSVQELEESEYKLPKSYIALGELKGGIDPARADEHWKTAGTALQRIQKAFLKVKSYPNTFLLVRRWKRRWPERFGIN